MVGGNVEIIHRAGNIEIAIGVKALDESHALVAQIALDLKIRIEAIAHRLAVLQVAAKLLLQSGFG